MTFKRRGALVMACGVGVDVDEADHLDWIAQTVPGFSYRCLWDPHWTMLLITDGVAELTGYETEDFILNRVRSYNSIIHPDDREVVRSEIDEALERGEPYYLEYRLVTRSGALRWVHERGRMVERRGRDTWLDGYIIDSTELRRLRQAEVVRKEAVAREQSALAALATTAALADGDVEATSRFATELMARAVDVARASVWLLDADKTRLVQMDLYRRDEDRHESGFRFDAEHHADYLTALESGRVLKVDNARLDPRMSSFRTTYLEALGITSLLDAAIRVGGEIVGVVCIEQVGAPRRWLDHEVQFAGAMADQISYAMGNKERRRGREERELLRERLFRSQKLEALGRLAGGVAHDFNNLLTVIQGYAEQLTIESHDSQVRADAREILRAAEQATELTGHLLAFARKKSLTITTIDLGTTVNGLYTMLSRLAGDDVKLTLVTPAEPVFVKATALLMQQLLSNLVINARDSIVEGGEIEVNLRTVQLTEPLPTETNVLPPGRYACLRVHDTGSGMDEAVRGQIFEPFFTTKEQGEGTGLGLAIVYGIVERCGGSIGVDSAPGEGTTFSVYFPALEGVTSSGRKKSPVAREGRFGAGHSILVVEDNRVVLELAARSLDTWGFEVRSALGTEAALRELEHWASGARRGEPPLSLILSDVVMPGGGGVRIRAWTKENLPDVPVAFITGFLDDASQRALEGCPRLHKPFSLAELRQFVRLAMKQE